MKRFSIFACSLVAALSFAAEDAATFAVSAFHFTRPAGWKQVEPSSTMRKAQLQVPGKDGAKGADVTFFFFGTGQGGDVQANVQRWLGQLNGSADTQKVEPQEYNGVKVTLVSTEGTLKASPMGGIPEDQPNSALLGAILEHEDGAVFIKMTGPAELVKGNREQFVALVKSATEKK